MPRRAQEEGQAADEGSGGDLAERRRPNAHHQAPTARSDTAVRSRPVGERVEDGRGRLSAVAVDRRSRHRHGPGARLRHHLHPAGHLAVDDLRHGRRSPGHLHAHPGLPVLHHAGHEVAGVRLHLPDLVPAEGQLPGDGHHELADQLERARAYGLHARAATAAAGRSRWANSTPSSSARSSGVALAGQPGQQLQAAQRRPRRCRRRRARPGLPRWLPRSRARWRRAPRSRR